MTAFSLGTAWEETIAFLRREGGLLVPVALAIYGPAQIMLDMGMSVAMPTPGLAQKTISIEMLLLIPGALLLLLGNLAIALIVLVPGISVGEAISRAVRRLPVALGAMLLLFAGAAAVGFAIVVAATLGAMTFQADPRSPALASQLLLLMMIPVGILWIRLLLLPAVLAFEPVGPTEGIRRAWALSRGQVIRFVGVWFVFLFLSIVVAMVEMYVVGSLAELLRLVSGGGELAALFKTLVDATIQALLSMAFAVFLAVIYRRLSAA